MGIDVPMRVTDEMLEGILAIRDTGLTNMFDSKRVFELAVENGYDELANLIFMNTKLYSHCILTGERELKND